MLQPPLNAPPTDQPLPKAQQPGSDPRREIASLPPLSAWLAKKHRNENKSLVALLAKEPGCTNSLSALRGL